MIEILLTAAITALVTATITTFTNGKVIDARLSDMKERVTRIERFLNGMLEDHKIRR